MFGLLSEVAVTEWANAGSEPSPTLTNTVGASLRGTVMDIIEQEALADEFRLAIAYTPSGLRPRLAALLAFDQRLARIIAQTSEPMLAQIRIAWWRDTLKLPVDERPQGDIVLDAMGAEWPGREESLIRLADAWEEMLAEAPIPNDAIDRFIDARAKPFAALSEASNENDHQAVEDAAKIWALADLLLNTTDADERAQILTKGSSLAAVGRALPKPLRGVAVLRALAWRSLKNGGKPLMEGRGAALVALRAAFFGR